MPSRRCHDQRFSHSADLRCEGGERRVHWDNELPPGGEVNYARSPIAFHDASQVAGTPLFEPANRFDLPFTTLTGLVDTTAITRTGFISRHTGTT
jgi:hypothetical protein